MADKNNVSSFFFNDESNPEDFYLNNDTPSSRKTGNLDAKKTTNVQSEPIFTVATPSVTARPVVSDKFSWNDPGVNEPTKTPSAFPSETNFADKGDVLSKRDHSISDEEVIDEILKTEVVNLDLGQSQHDYFADLDAKPTADFKEHDQSIGTDGRFSRDANEQNNETNLAELDALKRKLRDASESFSQISNSIEILSDDIDSVNRDFSDYLSTLGNTKEEGQQDTEETEPSVTKSIEELAKIVEPTKPLAEPATPELKLSTPPAVNHGQPTRGIGEVNRSNSATVQTKIESVKKVSTLSSVTDAAKGAESSVHEPVTPLVKSSSSPLREQPTEAVVFQPAELVQPMDKIKSVNASVISATVTEQAHVSPARNVESSTPPPVATALSAEPVPPKTVVPEVQPAGTESVKNVAVGAVEKDVVPAKAGDYLSESTAPLSKAEAALQAKLAELEPEINSFDEMIEAETNAEQKEAFPAKAIVKEKNVETKTTPDESVASKSKTVSLPDYSTTLADLKQQAVMQVQNAVQSELDRLVNAKAKLEAELETLIRNRDFENNITDLKERFSSIVSHQQETPPLTPTFPATTSSKPPVSEADESTSPIADVEAIEAQRTSIVNATKEIMEQYDSSDTAIAGETPAADERAINVAKEKLTEAVSPETNQEANVDRLVDEVDNIKKEIVNVIKSEVASAIKEEIADIKANMHHDKVAEAAEQLKTRILVDAANEKKKLDQLIQKVVTNEIGFSFLDENDKAADSLDEMRNSLRHRQVGNEVEEQSRLYDMDRIRHELKDEILSEVRTWNSNLFSSSESKLQQEPPAEQVLGDWFDANNDSSSTDKDENAATRSPSSRSANLVFNPEVANLKGRDLILKYVKDLTKKRMRKPK